MGCDCVEYESIPATSVLVESDWERVKSLRGEAGNLSADYQLMVLNY